MTLFQQKYKIRYLATKLWTYSTEFANCIFNKMINKVNSLTLVWQSFANKEINQLSIAY